MRIDAHQHYWQLSRGDYEWLTPQLKAIYRDFTPTDLEPLLQAHDIQGSILVQAAPSVAETQYLLALADRHSSILAVVGWVDLMAADAPEQIAQLAQHPKLRGLRPMIQDIQDIDWMLSEQLQPAIAAIQTHNLCFDALVLPQHLTNLVKFQQRYPDLKIVIDHCAKPEIAEGSIDQWANDIQQLAAHHNCYCKLSGLVTEAASDWKNADLAPYVNHLLNCFGSERMIWGSDWPVLNLASNYTQWLGATQALLATLSPNEQQQVFGINAQRFYSLP